VSIDEQSPDIAQGVDSSEELRGGKAGEDLLNQQGAGDQGMMFGYACTETDDLMPLPIWTAHRLAERLAEVRKSGEVPYLRPDGKTQVTFEYEDDRPIALRSVLISTQHQDGIDRDTVIRPDLIEQVIRPIVPEQYADDPYEVFVNPTGNFVSEARSATAASPVARSSSTPTAAWAATVAARSRARTRPRSTARRRTPPGGWPRTSWRPAPPSGASCRSPTRSAWRSRSASTSTPSAPTTSTPTRSNGRHRHLRPATGAIVRDLELKRPGYKRTAAYGHFGRPEFTWEATNKVDELKSALGL
jgi:S-adenosylmethionine synthetase